MNERVITVKELNEQLTKILAENPIIADCEIYVACESGFSGAGIAAPLTVVHKVGATDAVRFRSNDDVDMLAYVVSNDQYEFLGGGQ